MNFIENVGLVRRYWRLWIVWVILYLESENTNFVFLSFRLLLGSHAILTRWMYCTHFCKIQPPSAELCTKLLRVSTT